MRWSELTPEHRNTLVMHEVMHEKDATCAGKLSCIDSANMPPRQNLYICQDCRAILIVTKHFRDEHGLPKQHDRPAPRYSESLEAAWQIVEKLGVVNVSNVYLAYVAQAYTRCEIKYHQEGRSVEAVGDTPMEAICKAALKACGVELDAESEECSI